MNEKIIKSIVSSIYELTDDSSLEKEVISWGDIPKSEQLLNFLNDPIKSKQATVVVKAAIEILLEFIIEYEKYNLPNML